MQPAVAAGRTWRSSSCSALFKPLLILGTVFLLGAAANAQMDFTRIYGTEDRAVPMPALVGSLGQKDATALQELVDYIKAVNITSWQGMQASGTLTDGSGNPDPATLTILNGDHFRLDVQTPNGQRSIRISGSYGKRLEADGKSYFMPAATAKAGLLAFPRLLASTFPSATASFIDQGQVQINGALLHRITVEESAFPGETAARDVNVTDLYFDPSTHLLLKSASAVQLDPADRERYLIVIAYSDYQYVGGSLIPFTYSQSLNGQQQWTLQLNQPNLQPPVDASYFQF